MLQQPYHPVAQDWLPTEAEQGWAWLVPGWETTGKTMFVLEEVLVRPVLTLCSVLVLMPQYSDGD